jgi:hypothetical protein
MPSAKENQPKSTVYLLCHKNLVAKIAYKYLNLSAWIELQY